MSLKIEGQSCPVCRSYLFSEDDVVFCPTCGAPHHRDCYNFIGHCGLEEFHGTEQQYDRAQYQKAEQTKESEKAEDENTIVCQNCLHKLEEDSPVCPYCGRPRLPQGFRTINIDFLGGVPKNYDIGEGVTAGEVREFVAVNTQRYIPKFAKLNKQNKLSWNWMAFFFPEGWFFSRKMYKLGIFIITLLVSAQIFLAPVIKFLNGVVLPDYTSYGMYLVENINTLGKWPIILMVVSMILTLSVRIISAVFGDYIYKNYTIEKIKKIGEANLEKYDYFHKYGGVNVIMFMVGFLAATYLPNIVMLFL